MSTLAHVRTADRSTRADWLAALAVGAAALALFVRTLAPTVTAEDSGELITAAHFFGIPHPPGMPLWTLLCGMFLRLMPFGSIAWRANLFSAICTSAAAMVAYAALRQWPVRRWAAAAAALVAVLTRWSWKQSVITEVYSLNSLLAAAVLWAVLRWNRGRENRYLLLASLFLGLGMSNHHLIAFSALALLCWVLWRQPRLALRPRLAAQCIGAFLIGLLPYCYLPVRAAADPPMNWGNPSNVERFRKHVSRFQYGATGPTKPHEPMSAARFGRHMDYAARSLADDLTPLGAIVALAGVANLLRARHRPALVLTGLWLAAHVVLFFLISNPDSGREADWVMRVFLIPAHLGLMLPVAMLLDDLAHVRSAPALAGGLGMALPAVLAIAHFRDNDYSRYWYAYDNARNVLDSLSKNALFFPRGDCNTFPTTYLSLVERYRPDVLIGRKYGYVDPVLYRDRPRGTGKSPIEWIFSQLRRPIYYSFREDIPIRSVKLVPAGLAFAVVPRDSNAAFARQWGRFSLRNSTLSTTRDLGAARILSNFHYYGGMEALQTKRFDLALERFKKSMTYGEGFADLLNNIGVALGEVGREDLAIRYCGRSAELDPYYDLPRWNLYSLYLRRREVELARRQLAEILMSNPNDVRARKTLAALMSRSPAGTPGP